MNSTGKSQRLPPWLKKSGALAENVHAVKSLLRRHSLHTVCEEAKCPNIGECFARGTATIMIMGDVCTRKCGFCAVKSGVPKPLDLKEPARVAMQVKELGLRHAVITSVTRDDLEDGGAGHFAKTIEEIRNLCPETTIEVLTPDFEGREADIKIVCSASPDIFNHNIETIERLSSTVRNRADYKRSLAVLATARSMLSDGLIKSGLMVGLGESEEEVNGTLCDLRKAGCDIVTIGQYLRPAKDCLPVARYVEPELFREYEKMGLKEGFKAVFSGPFVRSSYLADKATSKMSSRAKSRDLREKSCLHTQNQS